MEKSKFMNEILRTTIKKMSIENKSKLIKKNTSLSGKKEYKSLPKSIPMLSSKSKSKTENQKQTIFLNGLSSGFMGSLTPNFTGPTLSTKSSKRMKARTSGREWARSMRATQGKSKG